MNRNRDAVGSSSLSGAASAELDCWTRRTLNNLRVLRGRRIGDQRRLRSALRTGETIERLLEKSRKSDAVRAMDEIDLAECLAQRWIREIHRILDDATVVETG
ncbi:hypothetical protein FHS27_001295 [Rhodopirellula rubra]|uniref:Uncharacterized protein n=1 Tax=Aporhodopirellula rubra TaxID=980271 RepID=A0A7W5H518_9BACT|nr:hypothetical protein [Aporhodopirellula rubra]